MTLGKVIGNIVSTERAIGYESKTILIIQPIHPDGNPKGKTFLAVDTVQAGPGDTVITIDEGGSAKTAIKASNNCLNSQFLGSLIFLHDLQTYIQ